MSDVNQALNSLLNLAGEVISQTSKRQIDKSREREANVSSAYNYLIGLEDKKIQEYQTMIDSLGQNLEQRGIDMINLKEEYHTPNGQELLQAANEGAIALLNFELQDKKLQKESYEKSWRKAMKAKRELDLFDEALAIVDPTKFGDENSFDKEDIIQAREAYEKKYNKLSPELEQYFTELSTETRLQQLTEEFYDKEQRELDQKLLAAKSQDADVNIKLDRLKNVKQQNLEAIGRMIDNPVYATSMSLRGLIGKRNEITEGVSLTTGLELTSNEIKLKGEELSRERSKLAIQLFPWAGSADGLTELDNLESALQVVLKGKSVTPMYQILLKGHKEYKNMLASGKGELASSYKNNMLNLMGIDISDEKWFRRFFQFNRRVEGIDIEEAELENIKTLDIFPMDPVDSDIDDQTQDEDWNILFGE